MNKFEKNLNQLKYWEIHSWGPLHMAERKQVDQLEPTYSSSVRIRGVALKTYRKRWVIRRGGKKGSGISVPMARHDDNENTGTILMHDIFVNSKIN